MIKKKGRNVVPEELKQRLQVKAMQIKGYNQRIKKYKTNWLFQQDQKNIYQQLNEKVPNIEKSNAEERRLVWINSWENEISHE